jgi:hypothetical protein
MKKSMFLAQKREKKLELLLKWCVISLASIIITMIIGGVYYFTYYKITVNDFPPSLAINTSHLNIFKWSNKKLNFASIIQEGSIDKQHELNFALADNANLPYIQLNEETFGTTGQAKGGKINLLYADDSTEISILSK